MILARGRAGSSSCVPSRAGCSSSSRALTVPDDAIFGRLPERQAPHIYSEGEIVDLLAAARR
ncbi:secreted protein, partial [mine drainage metagenome]